MRREDADSDRGVALITVIVLGMVMILFVATALTAASSGLRQAVSSQRSTSASDAAFAGVQDYLARVNADDSYVKYGNPLSTFSTGSVVTLPSPANPAFGIGTAGTWADVPGSDGTAKFRYEVDTTAYKTSGVVRIRVTGLAGDRTRTLVSSMRVRGFVDYSYFTDYEIQDPQISGAPAACGTKHAWEGRAANCGGVRDIRFGASDALSGDVHSNDTMIICGATFTGNITTANTGTPLYSTTGCGTTRTITNISRAASLPMPATNSSMREDAGCLYTGPTRVVYNPGGTMTVVSPWTKFTKVTAGVGSNNTAMCGAPGALASAGGATVPQLDHDLLYVQNVPAISTDPNYWSTTARPSGLTCIAADNTDSTANDGIGWAISSGGPSIRYPASNEAPATGFQSGANWATTNPAYGCRNGDLYVKGNGSSAVSTQTTAASENYVYVLGDILYEDQAADVLGLVGQNGVIVHNPMRVSDDQPILTDTGREIDAAIVSVAHTFIVQNFDRGNQRGTLRVFGSIAQKFRGPVAVTNPDTGYTKSYAYDPLLKTVSPPKFLNPSATSFLIVRYAAVAAAFDSTGAVR